MIPNSFIQELLDKTDLVDLINSYVPLKKQGHNHVGLCPFHNEKSGSFTVSSVKGFYHCFGCGVHGNAINFLTKHLGVEFPESISILADIVGMKIPVDEKIPDYDLISGYIEKAADEYHKYLLNNPTALDYLNNRGIKMDIIDKFKIGFSPDEWNFLKSIGNYQSKAMLDTGLVIEKDGNRYDRFRNRIMFPIKSSSGRMIGFGARIIVDNKDEAKYLNSPETPLFEKSKELYGLHLAKKSIQTKKRVLVVEGYMDVVALNQFKINYAVATLGTATTTHHIEKLMKLANEIVFCFDGDNAGKKAALRAMENIIPAIQDDKIVRFVFLPEKHDPDSYVFQYGKEQFENEIENSMYFLDFVIKHLCDGINLNSIEGKASLVKRSKLLLAPIQAQATLNLIQNEIAKLTGLKSEQVVIPTQVKQAVVKQKNMIKMPSCYRALLQCLLVSPTLFKELPILDDEDEDEYLSCIKLAYEVMQHSHFTLSSSMLMMQLESTTYKDVAGEVMSSTFEWGEDFNIKDEFNIHIDSLKEKKAKANRMSILKELMNKAKLNGLGSLSSDERQFISRKV